MGEGGITNMFAYDADAGDGWGYGHDASFSSFDRRCGSKRGGIE